MKRSLEKFASGHFGCGPCALSYLTGISPSHINGWTMAYRACNPISEKGLPCRIKNAYMSDECMFSTEIEAFLSMFAKREFKFKSVKPEKVTTFTRKLPKDKTYLLLSNEHAMVARNCKIWDTGGAAQKDFYFKNEIIVGLIYIPWIITKK